MNIEHRIYFLFVKRIQYVLRIKHHTSLRSSVVFNKKKIKLKEIVHSHFTHNIAY